MRLSVTLLAAVFLMFSQGNAQEEPLPFERIEKVASSALAASSELVTKENYRVLGFESADEVRIAKLGEPVRVFMVRLDQLQKYEPGSDPNEILSGGDRVVYPITVNGEVRSSISVEEAKDRWNATTLGGPNLVRMLTKVRKASSDSTRLPVSLYFLVQIPALNLYFVAHRTDDVLMFTPVLDDPAYGFKAGVTVEALKALEAILPAAKAHDGLPR